MSLKYLSRVALLMVSLAGTALASPIVVPNSAYSVYLAGRVNNNYVNVLNTGPVIFDANLAAFTRDEGLLTLTESQTDLGGGQHLITVTMMADGSLFPVSGEAAILGLGVQGTPLSFLQDVFLDSAYISLLLADGSSFFTTTNLADDYRSDYFTGPWSGYFADSNVVFQIGNTGAHSVQGFSFTFNVREINSNEVPEPDAAMLAGLTLLLALAVSLRKMPFHGASER